MQRLSGFSKEEVLGRKPEEFMHPNDISRSIKIFQEALKTGEGFGEFRLRRKDGSYVWLEANAKIINDEKGETKAILVSRDITKRKLIEEKLKESEEKYRLISENVNDLIIVINRRLKFEYVNEGPLFKMLGYSRDELIDKRPIDFIHPNDFKFSVSQFQKGFREGKVHVETRIKHKKGNYIWVEINGSIFLDKNKRPKIFLIARNITKRTEAIQKLRESEEKYKIITEHANDLISIIDEKFKWEYINENVHERLLGYINTDMIGKHVGFFIHPDDLKHSIEMFRDAVKNGESKGEIRFRNKEGSYVWLEFKGELFIDRDGKRKNFLISRDITERKISEQQLKESEEKFRVLYEKTYLGILLITTDGIIIDCNHSFEKILGFTKEEVIGKKYKDIGIVPEKLIPILLQRLESVSKGERIPTLEFKVRKKNGEMIWVRVKSTLVDVGVNSYIQIVGEDITEKKQAENLVKMELEKLKELDQVKTDLITRISHEIKTPLSLICGAAELLSEYYKEIHDNRANEIINILNRGGRRLKLLVKNLIDASKLESRNIKLEFQRENILEIIKNCINEIKFFAEKRNHFITLDFKEVIFVNVSRDRIEQVFMNILLNAVKNTPPNGKIYIDMKKYNGYIDILIRDTGVGLTEEEKPKLFKKFGKIERYGKGLDVDTQGSGLGLYISKKIVELHGGKVWAESEGRNKGSAFIIRLPEIS
ncbi:Sporulation kinase E [subsurface metagenome]